MDKKVENYIKKLKAPQKKIVEALRELVLKIFPDIKEAHHWNVLYYSPVCYITVHHDYVSFGFTHRKHFKLKKLSDIKVRNFKQLMREAIMIHESHR